MRYAQVMKPLLRFQALNQITKGLSIPPKEVGPMHSLRIARCQCSTRL